MKKSAFSVGSCAALLLGFSATAFASHVPKDLPYPAGVPTADEIANQVYFVNHFYAFSNFSIDYHPRGVAVILNKVPGRSPTTTTLERHLNNTYDDGVVKAKELVVFRTGKLKATGMLITDYEDDARSHSHSVWLPELRKIRRFAQPVHEDAWGGTAFTFGDMTLRKPFHETHELLDTVTFNDCLGAIDFPEDQRPEWMDHPMQASCDQKGKQLYRLKSTTKFDDWWYDYRISYVDPKTFADYRTEYFKAGEMIKVIDRDWKSMGLDEPRALSWNYWYGKDLQTQKESCVVMPGWAVKYNTAKDSGFWTEKTLRKLAR